MKYTAQEAIMMCDSLKEDFIKRTILEYTKIKEPITKGKLKWHGISLAQQGNLFFVLQRGNRIGNEFVITITT